MYRDIRDLHNKNVTVLVKEVGNHLAVFAYYAKWEEAMQIGLFAPVRKVVDNTEDAKRRKRKVFLVGKPFEEALSAVANDDPQVNSYLKVVNDAKWGL
jgi:hypothetical protein